ncbi:hypothetical protein JTE90_025074 [Oedothorax gibbosus]|uniref:Chitin-binding type-2 domain-containing protein n=1 Tax=Oedothorax gibbosus TaxID=931172 RepID=A0AAV6U7Z7_9ARAC|nr:hypothetical protein JTE90_025074 [Oedothorax gibbosus]
MGNLWFFLIVAVFCAVFGDALSQNRGSVRYGAPADEPEADVARPLAPNRGVRRRRPTSATESPPVEPQLQPEERTTGRRVPSSPRSQSPLAHPVEAVAPVVPEVIYDAPVATPAIPEDKSQGRRRRTRKRKRPQAAKDDVTPDVKTEDIQPINAEPQPLKPYNADAELRNNENSYDAGPSDKSKFSGVDYGENGEDSDRRNTGAQYFPPQSGTNRLPVENTEEIENARVYSEPTRTAPDSNRRYSPPQPDSERGSYVPVLTPARQSDRQRTPEYKSPISNSDKISRHYDSKPPQTQNTRRGQSNIQNQRHPENRLVATEPPHISRDYDRSFNNKPDYGNPVVVSLLGRQRQSENNDAYGPPKATNRLPNPSEDRYNPIYPYLDENVNHEPASHSSLPHRNENPAPYIPSDAIVPYSNVIPRDEDESPKAVADVKDNQELSRYEPPLTRSGASSQPRNPEQDKTEVPPRSRDSSHSHSQSRSETLRGRGSTADTPVETPTRTRGGSRYQPDSSVDQPSRTIDSTRHESDSSSGTPTRTRGSSRNQIDTPVDQPTRTRGANRYTTAASLDGISRTSDSSRPISDSSSGTSTRTRGSVRNQIETPVDQPTRTRGSNRYQQDGSLDEITRTRDSTRNQPDSSSGGIQRTRSSSRRQPESVNDTPTQTRGSSRPQPSVNPDAPTRGSSRYQPDSSIDRPTRTRSSQTEVPSPQSYRNTNRYQTDSEEDSRLNSRIQPPIPEVNSDINAYSGPQTYNQGEPERRGPAVEVAPAPFSGYAYPTNSPDVRDAQDPVRNTLRSRPQYEVVREPEESYSPYEESEPEADPERNVYAPEYQPPSRQETRSQRVVPQRQQSSPEQRPDPRQQRPEYRSPQPSTRRQPQSQQDSRPQARQQSRPRQEPAAPTPTRGRSSSGSKFECPEPYGFFADPVQCDKYYECRNGTAIDGLCEDGLAFNVAVAPKFLRCDSLRDVDCTTRPELQEPRPTANCPRRYGLYPSEGDCTKFFNCVDGTATEVQCPPGLTFNDERATCDWADLVKSSCKTEARTFTETLVQHLKENLQENQFRLNRTPLMRSPNLEEEWPSSRIEETETKIAK